jgi:hypothetical protein
VLEATTSTSSGAMAATMLAPGAIAGTTIIQGAGAAAIAAAAASAGGFNQPQLVMNTAAAPSTSTFNDCGIAFSGGLWLRSRRYREQDAG